MTTRRACLLAKAADRVLVIGQERYIQQEDGYCVMYLASVLHHSPGIQQHLVNYLLFLLFLWNSVLSDIRFFGRPYY